MVLRFAGSVLAAVLAASPAARAATILAGPVTNSSNGHVYYLVGADDSNLISWADAQTAAIGLGGNLATINDAAEQEWVFATFGYSGIVPNTLWIGLTDAAVEGVFEWVGGEPVTYTNWAAGEPNNVGGNEDYVHMFSGGGTWNDLTSEILMGGFAPVYGVVETAPVPLPGAWLMLTSALACLAQATARAKPLAA